MTSPLAETSSVFSPKSMIDRSGHSSFEGQHHDPNRRCLAEFYETREAGTKDQLNSVCDRDYPSREGIQIE